MVYASPTYAPLTYATYQHPVVDSMTAPAEVEAALEPTLAPVEPGLTEEKPVKTIAKKKKKARQKRPKQAASPLADDDADKDQAENGARRKSRSGSAGETEEGPRKRKRKRRKDNGKAADDGAVDGETREGINDAEDSKKKKSSTLKNCFKVFVSYFLFLVRNTYFVWLYTHNILHHNNCK